MIKKTVLTVVLVIALMIVGFIFLLRGCLAGYDERSAIVPAMYFEKDGKSVVFTIVKFDECTSYKSSGGMTQKSVSTSYYIQINDAVTGENLDKKKIKTHGRIKNHPVSLMGKGGGNAWVFIGEPMAFDPFTLEKIADKSIIEARNPALAGKMPDARTYYNFHSNTGELYITATNGQAYVMSTSTLLATVVDEDAVNIDPVMAKVKALEKKIKDLGEEDRAWYDKFREFNRLYNARKISYEVYQDSTRSFNRRNDTIAAIRKKIAEEMEAWKDQADEIRDRQRDIEQMNRGNGVSYTDMSVASDTFNGRWYGLMMAADLEKRSKDFQYRPVYTETSRNKLYGASVRLKDPDNRSKKLLVDEPEKMNSDVFLQGGFMLDKANALPIHLSGKDGFIICYREKVGHDGAIMLARIDLEGHTVWTVNTKLTEFLDWIFTGKRLVVFGKDNKELSSGQANVLLNIDLSNGSQTIHDFFTDKMRKP